MSRSHSALCPWFPHSRSLAKIPLWLGLRNQGLGHPFFWQRGAELSSLTGVPPSSPPLLSLTSPFPLSLWLGLLLLLALLCGVSKG